MRSIRKISLQNSSGQRFPLDGTDGVYASELSGFGFSLEQNFADLSRGFFKSTESELEPQQPIPFTITFTKNAYQTYRRLVDWLSSAGKITLVYKPFGDLEFFRDVLVSSIQKGELNALCWLEAPCNFTCLTPWYLPTPTIMTLEGGGNDTSKRYPYRYTENLRYGSDSTAALSGIIAPSGHIPGALEISYSGAIINPRIRLQGNITGKTYGICSVAVSLEASDTLKFSSRYEKSYVSKIAAGGAETDLLDKLDLITEPFFHIPVDEPCTLTIESDDIITGKAEVKAFYYYRSV